VTGPQQAANGTSCLGIPSDISLASYSFQAHAWTTSDFQRQDHRAAVTAGQSAALLRHNGSSRPELHVWGGASYIGSPAIRSPDESMRRRARTVRWCSRRSSRFSSHKLQLSLAVTAC
jgi:hypothetical protein